MKTLMNLKAHKIAEKKIEDITYYAIISNKTLKVLTIHYEKDGIVGLSLLKTDDYNGQEKFNEIAKHFEINRELRLKLRSLYNVA